MKFVDAKCPNCGGPVKLIPGSVMGKCENCGAELYVSAEVTDRIARSFDLISQKKYLAAKRILDETIILDVKNGQVYLGLLMCELEISSPNLLMNAKVDYSSNPNYIRACQFLDSSYKSDLQNLCLANINNLEKKKNATKTEYVPSDLAKEFTNLSQIDFNGEKASIIWLYSNLDFSKQSEKQIIALYKFSKDRMERMIEIYHQLSSDDKNLLEFFNEEEFVKASNLFLQIKEIVTSNGLDLEDNCSEDDEDDEYYDEDYDDCYSEENYEEDYDEELTNETNELENNNIAINEQIDEINRKISNINYEIGGLGLFNVSKKKELKGMIVSLEKEKNNLLVNFEIKKCELAIDEQKNILKELDGDLKLRVDKAKQNFDSTPFTAFKRRKELKEEYTDLAGKYDRLIKDIREKINNYTKQIQTLRKRLQ